MVVQVAEDVINNIRGGMDLSMPVLRYKYVNKRRELLMFTTCTVN